MTVPRTGVWRHFDRLPLTSPDSIVSLGEGDTPLIDLTAALGARLGLAQLVAKAEDRNPTGSFKARIATVAYSIVRERGLAGTVGTSSGNGGAAAAAYAAAAGSRAVLFTLSGIADVKAQEIRALGGTATQVDGIGHDAASTTAVADTVARAAAAQGFYPMLTAFRYAPEAMTGVETIAFELAEQAPHLTHVYVPVGGGGLLTGVHRGFEQYTGSPGPRFVGVHPSGGPLQRALDGHPEGISGPVTTRVSGLQMAALYDTAGAMDAIRSSGGHVTEVPDEEIMTAQRLLARSHGLLVEPAGATAIAGLLADVRHERLEPGARVAVVLTGAGYKDAGALARLAGDATRPPISPLELARQLETVLGTSR